MVASAGGFRGAVAGVVDPQGHVLGIFTDGDLRRTLDGEVDAKRTPIADVMTRDCITIRADMLAAEALTIMQQRPCNGLLVVDADGRLEGAMNMHDLLRAGVI